ncbi:putative cytochrome bd menaquinol oxidase subunit I [Geobacillus sp. TFV-3]|nr:putative cytochrome bd menaquinol oxidase subunit I [Geobacillus sp. TFV-3]
MLAIEAGWYLAEVGRQPWILRGYMKTAEAATSSGHVDTMLVLFSLLYFMLGIASVTVLVRMFRKNPIERELAERAGHEEVAP